MNPNWSLCYTEHTCNIPLMMKSCYQEKITVQEEHGTKMSEVKKQAEVETAADFTSRSTFNGSSYEALLPESNTFLSRNLIWVSQSK